MGKIPHEIFSFSIGYGIGQKYRPIRVSVLVLDRNQNSGFGRLLDRLMNDTIHFQITF